MLGVLSVNGITTNDLREEHSLLMEHNVSHKIHVPLREPPRLFVESVPVRQHGFEYVVYCFVMEDINLCIKPLSKEIFWKHSVYSTSSSSPFFPYCQDASFHCQVQQVVAQPGVLAY